MFQAVLEDLVRPWKEPSALPALGCSSLGGEVLTPRSAFAQVCLSGKMPAAFLRAQEAAREGTGL